MMRNLLACLLIVSTVCQAAVGTITEQVNTPPSIERAKNSVAGNKGTGVEMQDSIRTTRGKVGITFEDDTKVQINENSKLVIDDFVYDPKSKAGKLGVKIALGTVRYASGQIAKNSPQNVAVNTPSATIAVRGTDFSTTVDEIGASTVVLLPSCPFGWIDIARDCKTGEITVSTDVATVILNKPFQATKVENRGSVPFKPVILNLGEDAMNNMLIVNPPKQLTNANDDERRSRLNIGALDIDFLKEAGLVNVLDLEQKEIFKDKLSQNLLDQEFLSNILDIINAQLASQIDMLNNTKSGLLPDYNPVSGIVVEADELKVTLCRDDGSNRQCVTTPTKQNTTIYQTQGVLEFKNRVNTGGSTVITLIQK